MPNSKYSKVLTVIWVLAIIVIVGLLIFIGIDWYKTYITGADAENGIGEFDGYINNILSNSEQTNTENNTEVVEPNVNIENTVQNTTGGGEGSSNTGLTYKGYKVVGKIEIPKTDVSYVILDKVTPKSLETSIGLMYGAGINQVGNTVLAGHNFRNGTFFSNNKKLTEGDKIYLTDMQGNKVTYVIYHKYTTNANDFSYATRDTKGKREVSLTTCTDDTKNRLVIWAAEE